MRAFGKFSAAVCLAGLQRMRLVQRICLVALGLLAAGCGGATDDAPVEQAAAATAALPSSNAGDELVSALADVDPMLGHARRGGHRAKWAWVHAMPRGRIAMGRAAGPSERGALPCARMQLRWPSGSTPSVAARSRRHAVSQTERLASKPHEALGSRSRL